MLKAADLFCGGGGTSAGAEASEAARVVCAVNHWGIAVETHSRNFPHTLHINSRVDQASPGDCPAINLLFASPECTHHSRARGGRPTSDQQRSGAWDIMRWVEWHRPSFVVVENVREWMDWGPVGENGQPLKSKKGAFFSAWVKSVEAAGYRVDHAILNAADFGAATSRERLFVIARKGNRSPIFPEPTHSRQSGGELPGMGRTPWRTAAEVIDWSIPCRSVFLRSKPLADKTLARIEAGLRRFVGPFVATLRNNATAASLNDPLSTMTAGGGHHGLAVPFSMSSLGGGVARSIDQPTPTLIASGGTHLAVPYMIPFLGERDGQGPRTHSVGSPLPAITTANGKGLAVPFLADVNHGSVGEVNGRTNAVHDPLGTLTTKRGKAVCVPFLVSYYGNGDATGVTQPIPTVTTKDRFGLVTATIELAESIEPRTDGERRLIETMRELGIADIGFRMLSNPELAAATGFPADYWFAGTKADVTRQIGNAVPPPIAEAITRTLAG